ncbi:MAG: hypothetical protein IPN32_00375 [Deltaproteobacteria bacterium]|nr:hypothetical protein [Deltaproteobacteria bacterium]
MRSLIAIAAIGALVWCSFHVPIGRRTFSEHVDRIGATPEAKELIDSTRHAVTPALEDATDRMLGEYVEAATAPVDPRHARPPQPAGAITPARTAAGPPPRGRLPSQ